MNWPFYRPPDGKVGDVMPCFFHGRFYIYYLRFGMHGDKGCNEWSVCETGDFARFGEDRRIGIFGGTGEVFLRNGIYHLFKETEPNVIGHYVGDTPYAFSDTGLRLPSDDEIYVPWAWRDPKILWVEEEQCYWMLVATNRKTGSTVCRNGCVGLCKSKDLYHWNYAPPLYSPLAHDGTYECPDLFRMGDWYYLLYSNANENKMTHYVRSKSIHGPWLIPTEDTIDSFLFYAGRTASDGKDRYIAAWNPERTGTDLAMKLGLRDVDQTKMMQYADLAPLGYAGDMVLHRLRQRENGDLRCELIPAVRRRFVQELPLSFSALQGAQWHREGNTASVDSPGRYSCALAGQLPECSLTELTIRLQGREAGIVLGADASFNGTGLFLRLQPARGRLSAFSGLRNRPYIGYCMPFAVEQEKPAEPDETGAYRLQVLRSGELVTVYLNGAALSLRAADAVGGSLGLFVFDGNAVFSELIVREINNHETEGEFV